MKKGEIFTKATKNIYDIINVWKNPEISLNFESHNQKKSFTLETSKMFKVQSENKKNV